MTNDWTQTVRLTTVTPPDLGGTVNPFHPSMMADPNAFAAQMQAFADRIAPLVAIACQTAMICGCSPVCQIALGIRQDHDDRVIVAHAGPGEPLDPDGSGHEFGTITEILQRGPRQWQDDVAAWIHEIHLPS
jgi:hypothetical protein